MWGTDMTTTALATGKQVAVFVDKRPSLGGLRGAARCRTRHALRSVAADPPTAAPSDSSAGLRKICLGLKTYSCIEDLQRAPRRFKDTYNEQWLIERHRHRSPNQFTRDEMDEIPIAA